MSISVVVDSTALIISIDSLVINIKERIKEKMARITKMEEEKKKFCILSLIMYHRVGISSLFFLHGARFLLHYITNSRQQFIFSFSPNKQAAVYLVNKNETRMYFPIADYFFFPTCIIFLPCV